MELFTRLRVRLSEFDASILHLQVFGSTEAGPAGTEALRRVFGHIEYPVTWVEGAACDNQPIAGLQAFAVTGTVVERITLGRQVVGSVFAEGATRHCLLGGLGPNRKSLCRQAQTAQTFENLEQALEQAGFALADTLRTWFFLDELLSWYAEFNQVRTERYGRVNFRSGSIPASTGVAGRNPAGTALAVAAWAVQRGDTSTRIEEVASPLQCPAPAYGSSFSRAMEISSPAGRRLFISGTASIALEGQTMWKDNIHKQVALTMDVVTAILRSRGFTLNEVSRATAYFKNRGDVRAFRDWCAAHNARSLPVVAAECAICRDDLLFELEADACK
jgi:enamine deaminase RidA (YjgF/YER057c/UK114 family)